MTTKTVSEIAADHALVDRITDIRRDIHANPEMAFEEHRTSALVASFLEDQGIEVHRGLAGTGVVGVLKGAHPGPRRIALRADMDALPITEATGKPYASTKPGTMHACGHDGHTAMLLGAAEVLARDPDFEGEVVFVFQPAEEGKGGARVMIEDGLFDRFPCDAIYGVHNDPKSPLGSFATRVGPMLSAADTWQVVFSGTGGHGGIPFKATDPTAALGAFLTALPNIGARETAGDDPAVLSVGYIDAGSFESPNVIPSRVTVRGTGRSYRPETRDLMESRLTDIADHVAALHRCSAEIDYDRRYPSLINTSDEVALAVQAAEIAVEDAGVTGEGGLVGASEDFAYYLEKIPGAFVTLGNGIDCAFVHTPEFDFDDALIPYGIAYWCSLVAVTLAWSTK